MTHNAPPSQADPITTVALVSLGCPKNLVDSEKMLGLLAEGGLVPVSDESQADAIVINTCGFLEASKQESLDEIRRAAGFKSDGGCKRLIVAGCLVQRHRAKLLDWCPEVDALIGVFDRDRIVCAVTGADQSDTSSTSTSNTPLPVYSSIAANDAIARQSRPDAAPVGYHEDDTGRLRLTPRHYAYLRVSEGCNQNCSFCTIPSIRGKMRSKPPQRILAEARELIADGAFELNLIGQDTTSYGDDIGYAPGLTGLLEELDREAASALGPGAGWLRLMYAYPSTFTDAMIDAIARLSSVVKYIDMPLQHINDRILDQMRRRTSRSLIETLLGKLRTRVNGIAIRTTFITGYPGETDADHRELVDFVRAAGFEAMGVFPYSPEPGTPAGTQHTDGQAVDPEVVVERLDELMLAQQQVAFARNERLADDRATCDVLVDGIDSEDNRYVGRAYHQAPQIDGVTYIDSDEPLSPGELVRCEVVEADGYDLIAKPQSQSAGGSVALPVITVNSPNRLADAAP